MPKLGKCTKPLVEPKKGRIKTDGGNGGYNKKSTHAFENIKGHKSRRDYDGNHAGVK